ncbi:MAG: hypothetical protein IJX77_03335 [Ruminococcus sp.]|nr:hypothetical protein [Ruminococcus sp.]
MQLTGRTQLALTRVKDIMEETKKPTLRTKIIIAVIALFVIWMAMIFTGFCTFRYDREKYEANAPLFTFTDSRVYDEKLSQWYFEFKGPGYKITGKSEPGFISQIPVEKSVYIFGLHIVTGGYDMGVDDDSKMYSDAYWDWF